MREDSLLTHLVRGTKLILNSAFVGEIEVGAALERPKCVFKIMANFKLIPVARDYNESC